MSSTHRQVRDTAALFHRTGSASAAVIAARMLAFANPATAGSTWHLAEAQRMSAEKLDAVGTGMQAAGIELALLPGRMLALAARPSAWTPLGWLDAWASVAGLWLGVGNAALRPASVAAVRNRSRLARRRR